MDVPADRDTVKFKDLLEPAGLQERVTGATHRCGHTLDLVIDRQEESRLLSPFETLTDLPSDHFGVLGSLEFPKPCSTKKTIARRDLRRLEQTQWCKDLTELLYCNSYSDVNSMTEHFNSVLRELLDKHAPLKTRSVRLRPNSPWFTDSLRELKGENFRCERKFRSTNLEVHRQIYKQAFRAYTNALNIAKTTYYKEKISGASNDQLFKMINGLFCVKAVPPLPSHDSLPALADTFSGFYHSKIVKLREKLEQSEFSAMDLSTVLQPPTCQTAFLDLHKYHKCSSQS